MIFLGIDWAESRHDACLVDEQGGELARARVGDTLEGVGRLQSLVAVHARSPDDVLVTIETPRGLLVRALRAAGYRIYPVNPLSVARYRERHSLSRAKSDRADAKLLADLGRTDHHNQRPLPEDTEQAEAVKILARSHKQLIWSRQSSFNQLRQTLREFYPAALQAFELDSSEALVILSQAPTPLLGARLSQAKLVSGLRQAGRRQNLEARAARIQSALRTPQLEQPALVAEAHGKTVAALVGVLREVSSQIATTWTPNLSPPLPRTPPAADPAEPPERHDAPLATP